MDNKQPLAFFCNCDGFEVSLTNEGLNVKTNSSAEFFCLATIKRLQVITQRTKKSRSAAGQQVLMGLAFLIGAGCLAAGDMRHAPLLAVGGLALLLAGAVLAARMRSRAKKEALVCYLRVELNDAQHDYPFEGNLIKRLDMSALEAHFNQLKALPPILVEAG